MAELPDAIACSREGFFAPRGFPCEDQLTLYATCRTSR
jgi:hypothetical protein